MTDATNSRVNQTVFLKKALDCTRTLRCNVIEFVQKISSSTEIKDENLSGDSQAAQDNREKYYKLEIVTGLQKMILCLNELARTVSAVTPSAGMLNLGSMGLLSQEVAPRLIPLYSQLSDTYKWTDKARSYAETAHLCLRGNCMQRTYFNGYKSSEESRRLSDAFNIDPECVNNAIAKISNAYIDMDITVTRPLGSNSVLSITLGSTLKGVVILKGWLIEWVVIRAFNEDMTNEDGTMDLWSESRYTVFQKVTDNANAAMLHFYAPNCPELCVKCFMIWLHSYITLFSKRCKKCALHLDTHMMPPTWRDLRDTESYHEGCKPVQ